MCVCVCGVCVCVCVCMHVCKWGSLYVCVCVHICAWDNSLSSLPRAASSFSSPFCWPRFKSLCSSRNSFAWDLQYHYCWKVNRFVIFLEHKFYGLPQSEPCIASNTLLCLVFISICLFIYNNQIIMVVKKKEQRKKKKVLSSYLNTLRSPWTVILHIHTRALPRNFGEMAF